MKRIFVSSVQKEFAAERAAIKRMVEADPIINQHFRTFVFELDAPASAKSTQQVYLNELEHSEIYLLLIGDKYGWQDSDGRSPTECEYDRAVELGLPILVMVRGTDDLSRDEEELKFLKKVSNGRTRVRYQESGQKDQFNDLLDEVRNSIRDIMIDDGTLSEMSYEDQCPSDVSLDDIDARRIEWFVEKSVRMRKTKYPTSPTVEDVLRSLHLLNRKTQLPTNAAILLFGHDVQGLFPSSAVKCASYLGVEKRKPNEDIELFEGDLFQLADQAIEFVNRHVNNRGAGEHTEGAAADAVEEIPNSVIAEAVNNAIAHRNYASVGSIQIEVYANRVEIINPGRLHYALTIKDLYKKHESYPPNLRIARAMYQVKYIESVGTGLTDLIATCKKVGLPRPLLEEVSGHFRIVIWRKDAAVKEAVRRYEDLVFLIDSHPEYSIMKMSKTLCWTVKEVRSMLNMLRASNFLRREGAKKNGCWKMVRPLSLEDFAKLNKGQKT